LQNLLIAQFGTRSTKKAQLEQLQYGSKITNREETLAPKTPHGYKEKQQKHNPSKKA
jgi:hypothetical protein